MSFDDLFELGYVEKAHGLGGEVTVFIDSDFPENYSEMESVIAEIEGNLIPFFVSNISLNGHRALVRFEDVKSRPQAEALKGKKLYLPLDFLPRLEDNQFYYHEIYGFEVRDLIHGSIGNIKTVYDMPGDDLMAVEHQSKEILIPINNTFISKVRKLEKEIEVNLPDGFLDIYS